MKAVTYSDLDEPADAFEGALLALYLPGQLELGRSTGEQEALDLLRAVEGVRGGVTAVRRALVGEYDMRSATVASPAFLRALRRMMGLLAASTLEPHVPLDPASGAMTYLRQARVEAATALVVAGVKKVQDALTDRLLNEAREKGGEGEYFAETLRLFLVGTNGKPYPLTDAEAAKATEWFPTERTGVITKILHEPALGKSCPHCVARRPGPATMRQRFLRLRVVLAKAIFQGLNLVELGFPDGGGDVRRQAR